MKSSTAYIVLTVTVVAYLLLLLVLVRAASRASSREHRLARLVFTLRKENALLKTQLHRAGIPDRTETNTLRLLDSDDIEDWTINHPSHQ